MTLFILRLALILLQFLRNYLFVENQTKNTKSSIGATSPTYILKSVKSLNPFNLRFRQLPLTLCPDTSTGSVWHPVLIIMLYTIIT